LGGGTPLFNKLQKNIDFECVHSKIYLKKVIQNRFVRKKSIKSKSAYNIKM
jgi:hypothetical protein